LEPSFTQPSVPSLAQTREAKDALDRIPEKPVLKLPRNASKEILPFHRRLLFHSFTIPQMLIILTDVGPRYRIAFSLQVNSDKVHSLFSTVAIYHGKAPRSEEVIASSSQGLSRQTAVLPMNTAGEPNLFPMPIGGWRQLA
jgi:hypothetical protein